MKKKSFIKGAAILGIAGILVKVIGAFFRIPLANFLSDEGMSFYQTPYPIYNWLLVISTAGLPAAIAKSVSEKLADNDLIGAHKIFKVSLKLLTIIGIFSSIFMYLLAGTIATAVKNPLAVYSIRAIAPAIVFISMMSVYRGYFNGHQELVPYGVSQIFEQIGRVTVGLSLALIFLDQGEHLAAAGATFGATAGAIVGFIVIVLLYQFKYKDMHIHVDKISWTESKFIIKKLIKIAIPITIGASIIPIMSIIDLAIVMRRLTEIGFGETANDLYGQLTAYAGALINIPQVMTAGIQISIIPAASAAFAKAKYDELKEIIRNGIRTAVIIGIPSSVGLTVMAKEIMYLLYPLQKEVANNAYVILQILGTGFVFLALFQVTSGILQGIGKYKTPAKNLFTGAIVKVFLVYFLVGIPALNIKGAAISTFMTYFIACMLNLRSLNKTGYMHIKNKRYILGPAFSGIVMGIFVKIAYLTLSKVMINGLATLISIGFAVIVYIVMIFVTKSISVEELEMIPGGKKIRKLVRKIANV
ncbi:MAG: polysaccharide biosynthesis protein [Clostridiales bacterium]|nr:polysaccharide biosynthesis protein [Clostridiales bacterium]